jgi:hypothetical protein
MWHDWAVTVLHLNLGAELRWHRYHVDVLAPTACYRKATVHIIIIHLEADLQPWVPRTPMLETHHSLLPSRC